MGLDDTNVFSEMLEWWPRDRVELERLQRVLAARSARVSRWLPPSDRALRLGGVFVASPRGYAGAGAAGDPAWAAAVVMEGRHVLDSAVLSGLCDAPYAPGLLALREGRLMASVVKALVEMPDVLLVNATGRDHPRRAGLALHLGAALDLPTIGVTDRPLIATSSGDELRLDDEVVGYCVRLRPDARPVFVHAGWRTDPGVAADVVRVLSADSRTPLPLREARRLARTARSG